MKWKPPPKEVDAAVQSMMAWVAIQRNFTRAEIEQIAIGALMAAAKVRLKEREDVKP